MMKRACRLTVFFIVFFSLPAVAQEESDAGRAQDPHRIKIDIDFPGGSLQSLLERIEGRLRMKPNVIVSDEAAEIKVPPVRLQSVEVREILEAIGNLQVLNGWRIRVITGMGILTVKAEKPKPKETSSETGVRAYGIEDLLEKHQVGDLLAAIEMACDMQSGGSGVKLKFHDKTKLLIAAGARRELELIENVLDELKKGLKSNLTSDPLGALAGSSEKIRRIYKEAAERFREKVREWTGKEKENDEAELHVVGVYEGTLRDEAARGFREHPRGTVKVFVNRVGKPIILALCAYEPVMWEIVSAPGAELEKVILGGYHRQGVKGIGPETPVIRRTHEGKDPSFFCAHEKDEKDFPKLERELRKIISLEISSFQGRYRGKSFKIE